MTATDGSQGTTVVNADFSITYEACSGAECAATTVTVTSTAPTCDGLAASLWASATDTTIFGTRGHDVIVGFAGNDTIRASSGGGPGRDFNSYGHSHGQCNHGKCTW